MQKYYDANKVVLTDGGLTWLGSDYPIRAIRSVRPMIVRGQPAILFTVLAVFFGFPGCAVNLVFGSNGFGWVLCITGLVALTGAVLVGVTPEYQLLVGFDDGIIKIVLPAQKDVDELRSALSIAQANSR